MCLLQIFSPSLCHSVLSVVNNPERLMLYENKQTKIFEKNSFVGKI